MSLQTIGRVAVALALFALPGSARASTSASVYASDSGVSLGFEYFEDDLDPYGEWIDTPSYGTCWVPANSPHGWRPYSDGYWAYTDCGWSWVSNEPWGWATYHYGRWFHDPYNGWMWMPGNVWAPSWVAWHCGDGYVGWAPLPPAAHWNVSIGLNFRGVDRISSRDWCYVDQRDFTHSQIKYKIIDSSHNDRIHRRTRNTTRFESWDGRPKNVGLDVAAVNDWGGGKVKKLNAVDASSSRKGRAERVRGNSVEYFRPDISREAKARVEDRQVKRPTESGDRQLTKRSVKPAERELVKSREARAPRGGREVAMTRESREVRGGREVRRPNEARRPNQEVRRPNNETRRPAQEVRRPNNETRRPAQEVRRPNNEVRRQSQVRPTEERRMDERRTKARSVEPTRREAPRQIEQRRTPPTRREAPRQVEQRRTPPSRRDSAQRVEERRTAPSQGKQAQRSENRRQAPSKSQDKSAKPRGK